MTVASFILAFGMSLRFVWVVAVVSAKLLVMAVSAEVGAACLFHVSVFGLGVFYCFLPCLVD